MNFSLYISRFVYKLVKKYPTLKNVIKRVVQYINIKLYNKQNEINREFHLIPNAFFGFHDKNPFSYDDKYIIYLKSEFDLRMPDINNKSSIYIKDLGKIENGEKKINETYAWNWHQGCMLQWIDENSIGFNNRENNKIYFDICDLNGNRTQRINKAISVVSKNGDCIGHDFIILNQLMPGYGYNLDNNDSNIENSINKSLYCIELNSHKIKWEYSIKDICNHLGIKIDQSKRYFISHVILNAAHTRLLFLLRYVGDDLNKRISNLITCSVNGGDFYRVNTGDMCSHMTWINNDKIAAYCTNNEGEDGLYIYNDKNDSFIQKIDNKLVPFDTHPNYCSKNNKIICDSYPDNSLRQNLFTIDLDGMVKENIAILKYNKKFISDNIYNNIRCDLHPRWNRAGTKICIDTTFLGNRSLMIITNE